jgi:uncharacterized protein (TIGR02246 family)
VLSKKDKPMRPLSYLFLITFLLGVSACERPPISSKPQNNSAMHATDVTEITSLLTQYEAALNASDTKAVLALYAEDGVFMPSEAPTSIGHEAVAGAYNFVFSQIKLSIKFSIDEIVPAGDVAFARTISRGQVTVLEPGITAPEENRELFVFKREDGDWKIARYIFNKMSKQGE